MQLELGQIPGYREAVAFERAARDASFIDAPETLAGFPVASLTLRRYLTLRVINHPLLMGRIPSPWELAGFLWLMHPAHTVRGEFPREFAARIKSILPSEALHPNTFLGRVRMRRDARKLAVAAAVVIAVQTWIDRQFADAGMGDSGGGHSKEYWSPGCSMVLQLARETGWSEKDILDIPLTRLFQYQKITMRIHGDKTPLFNPSDRVLNLWLKERNRTNN